MWDAINIMCVCIYEIIFLYVFIALFYMINWQNIPMLYRIFWIIMPLHVSFITCTTYVG